MAFFNYVNPWPEATHWPLRCSAPGGGGGMPPCGRADFGPETGNSKFRVAPRASFFIHMPYAPLDRLPGLFRTGRSGWPKTQFGPTMGAFCMIGIPLGPGPTLRTPHWAWAWAWAWAWGQRATWLAVSYRCRPTCVFTDLKALLCHQHDHSTIMPWMRGTR
jgi:hypothetical protein